MVVWTNMLPDDADANIGEVAGMMRDNRVRSFHDPERRASEAIAAALGAEGMRAWDVYLFFDSEAEWGDRAPGPHGWVHQLTDAWADPIRRRRGRPLEAELAELLADVLVL
jgi:hypothetical protein